MEKNILIDARLYGIEHTGIGRYLMELIEELKNLRIKENKNKNEIHNSINYILLLRKKYFNELKFPVGWKKICADFDVYGVREQIMLPIILYREKPDLVHFPHFNVPLLWIGKNIVTIHDLTMHYQKRNASKLNLTTYLIKRIPYRMVFSKAVYTSKKIITPSNAIKKEIASKYRVNKKISVIYEGYKKGIFNSEKTADDNLVKKLGLNKGRYFMYVGSSYPHKNIDRLIEAFKQVSDRIQNVQLLLVLKKDHIIEKYQKIISMGKLKNIVITSGINDRDLVSLYKHSLCFVYPSVSEGFGLQGIEAMASGTIVLASNISVFREVYKNNAFYFDPYDVIEIAKKMNGVVDINKRERDEIILRSGKFVKQYSWNNTAQRTINLYESCLGL